MRAIADNVAVSAQYSVLQCNRIQRTAKRKQATTVRLVHHRPLGRGSSFQHFAKIASVWQWLVWVISLRSSDEVSIPTIWHSQLTPTQ